MWTPIGDPELSYRYGKLKFELRGQKLIGKWVLVRMKGNGGKKESCLLRKKNDALAKPADEFSVVDALPYGVNEKSGRNGKPKAKTSTRGNRASAATRTVAANYAASSKWTASEGAV